MKRIVLLVVMALALHAFLLAQAPSSSPPPGWIDGSQTPDLIPDQAAFRLVFLAMSVPPSPSQNAVARQNAVFKRIGFSDADAATLQAALITFAASHSAWEQSAANGASAQLVAQGWAIVQSTVNALSQQLTTDGYTKLIKFMTQEKTRMKVMP
jgi:hypothetical protein